MNPSPQYLQWLKGEDEGYDWIDVTNYILIANAELTDYNLSNGEIGKLIEACDEMFGSWCGEGVPYTEYDVKKKLQKAVDWYKITQDSATEDQMDSKLLAQVRDNMRWLREQDWFNPMFAKTIIRYLIRTAEVDSVNENEKESINFVAEYFGLEKPMN